MSILKKTLAAALAVSTLSATMTLGTGAADARWRGGYGPAVGLGILGGVAAGALIAGSSRPGYYYDDPYYAPPARAYSYDDGPVCHIERRKVYLDDYTYRIRKVRVCD